MKAIRTLCPAGFTLVEIMTIMVIIGLLTAIVIPDLMNARVSAPSRTGINCLGRIDGIAGEFVMKNDQTVGGSINFHSDLTPGIGLNLAGGIPGCPAGYIGNTNAMGVLPDCSLCDLAPPPYLLQ